MKLLPTIRRGRKGQSLAEFAMVIPVVVGLFVALVEFGQAWHSYQVVTHAAREGARVSIVPNTSEGEVRTMIEGMLRQASLDPARAEIILHVSNLTGTADTVIIRYPHGFPMLGPVVGLLQRNSEVPGAILLTTSSVMRNE
jgi:hypothetical protein